MMKTTTTANHTATRLLRRAALAVTLMLATTARAQSWDLDVAADSTLTVDSTFFAGSPSQLYRYYFIEAVAQHNRGNDDRALELLQRCIALNPEAAEAHYEISGVYLDQQNDSLACASIERAAALQPLNHFYVEQLGRFRIKQQRWAEATQVYEQLYQLDKSRADVVEMLYRLYAIQDDPDHVIEMLTRLETIEGSSEQISLSKMQIYEQLGKKGKQLDELKALVAKHPNDPNYRTMMANWLIQNDRLKEALAELRAVLREDPDNESAQMSMLDYYNATGQPERTEQLLDQLLASSKTSAATKLTLLQQTIARNVRENRDDSVKTLRMLDHVLADTQQDASVLLFKAAYMRHHNMDSTAVERVYEQAIAVEPDNMAARMSLIMSIWPRKEYDRVIELSRQAQDYDPTEMVFYYYEGMAEFLKEDNEAALQTFRKGVTQINEDSNPDLASDFYAIMGDLLHEKGLDTEAFAAYDSCLAYKADNVGCLNNYAYYLCLKDSLLDRAEQMSRKTIEEEPDNSTYLDTYAWILFQQGRYAEALTHIEHAVEVDSTLSSVVKEHTGDIYAMNGNIDKALEYWQMALAADKDNALLQEKIKQRRYIKQ